MISLTLTDAEAQQLVTLLLNSNPLIVKIINQIQQGQQQQAEQAAIIPDPMPNGLDTVKKNGGEP